MVLAISSLLPWLSIPYCPAYGPISRCLHYFVPCAVAIFNGLCLLHLDMELLVTWTCYEYSSSVSQVGKHAAGLKLC